MPLRALSDAPLRGPAAIPDLLASLDSKQAAERFWAALGFGQLGADSSITALQSRLKDESPTVILAAVWSLQRLGKTDAASLAALRGLLRSRAPMTLMETIQIVHHIGPAAAPLEPEPQPLIKTKTPPLYARKIGYAAEFALKSIQSP